MEGHPLRVLFCHLKSNIDGSLGRSSRQKIAGSLPLWKALLHYRFNFTRVSLFVAYSAVCFNVETTMFNVDTIILI